ncbi:MAG: GNAT family N-acetyltransferase, partial [Mycobacteriales bacterium]
MATKPIASVCVRTAVEADLPALLELLNLEQEVTGRRDRSRKLLEPAANPDLLGQLIGQPDSDVLLAVVGEEPVGMAVLWLSSGGPLAALPVAQVSHLVVNVAARRRGIGQALIAAAASWADEHGAEHLVAHVYPGLRDANRFYARLAFAPVTTRRVASVALLRRQLAPAEARRAALALPRR